MGRICGSRVRRPFLATGEGMNEAVLLLPCRASRSHAPYREQILLTSSL